MKEDVANILLEVKAVTLSVSEPYTFTSGIKSPIYCDNRLLISYPEERKKIVKKFLEILETLEFDVIAGTSTAGIPWAAWIAAKLEKPMVYIREKAKEHGKGNQVEGKLEKGQKAVIIEDLISTGGSSAAAVQAAKDAGAEVEDCVAIFTYEMEKANQKFLEARCKLHTLTNFSTLMKVAEEKDYVNSEEKEKALEWNKNPGGWERRQNEN